LATVALLAACGGGDEDEGTTTEGAAAAAGSSTEAAVSTEATTAAEATSATTGEAQAGAERPADADLVIWIDSQRAPALKPAADKFGQDNGVKVALQEVAFDKIRDQLQVAGPAGKGPDIIVGAHDWLGELTKNGLLAPVDLGGKESEFLPASIQAFTYDGQLYGVPYAVENVALFRNTELVPQAPKTFEELEKTALQLQKAKKVKQGLVLPATPPDPYHNYPLFTSFGGYVFGQTEQGYDPTDLGIDSPGGLKAANAYRRWVKEGLINPDVSGDIMQDMFGKGQAAFAITGPWALVQDGKGFSETGVKFEVTPIPPVAGGEPPKPFLGVQGFMISADAKNALLAQTFAQDAVASEELQTAMFEGNGRPPAMTAANEKVVAENPVFEGFAESGKNGYPMPAIPEMASVWSAWENAYALIYQGKGDPEKAMKDAGKQIRGLIKGG
jgi:maltose-binding protein MalE